MTAQLQLNSIESSQIIHTLITANHILDNQQLVDTFGHIQVRIHRIWIPDVLFHQRLAHNLNPFRYFLSGYLAPGLVSSPADVIKYFVFNSTPVDPNVGKCYSGRFIHREVL